MKGQITLLKLGIGFSIIFFVFGFILPGIPQAGEPKQKTITENSKPHTGQPDSIDAALLSEIKKAFPLLSEDEIVYTVNNCAVATCDAAIELQYLNNEKHNKLTQEQRDNPLYRIKILLSTGLQKVKDLSSEIKDRVTGGEPG